VAERLVAWLDGTPVATLASAAEYRITLDPQARWSARDGGE
jgi:hypothetical protein